MGTTPIFGFPYPDPSDLVANYPATAQQLAEDVEDAIYDRKILQVVRATDTTNRTTTSTSFVDVTGMSVTITPQNSDSAVLLIASVLAQASTTDACYIQITDNSDNAISGAQVAGITSTGLTQGQITAIAYATPATTSAVTYKTRFRTNSGTTGTLFNNGNTGQMYAIEVSA
jgi:PHD/YefM family antitoxin component YafN of YafNO toxin-antitoxin module